MPSFSSDFCSPSAPAERRYPFSTPPPISSAVTASTSFHAAVSTSPEAATVLPSRLIFSPTATTVSPSVPKHTNGIPDDVSPEGGDHFLTSESSVGAGKGGVGKLTSLKTNRKSLDGSFRIITSSTASRHRSDDSSSRRHSPNDVCNSTPLTTNAEFVDFDIASPIFRSNSQSSTPVGKSRVETGGGGGDGSYRSKNSPQHRGNLIATDVHVHSHVSQLSKELVVTHSYQPPRCPYISTNPLGIYPRRSIHQRRDLTSFGAFSSTKISAVLSPVINRIQSVVETMSPRKRAKSRPAKTVDSRVASGVDSQPTTSPPKVSQKSTKSNSTRSGLFFIFVAFFSSSLLLYFLYTKTPHLTEEERLLVKYPRSIEDAKGLAKVLSAYKDDHFEYIVLGFFAIYNFLQTFAIPGSIFLSILSGFLFPFPLACFLVSLCSAAGASFCYLLSSFVGKPIMNRYFASRVEEWRQHVEGQRHNLLSYIIFLRITPFLPNWFINITSPIINVPLTYFFIGTFIGVAPPSFVYISAGQTLHTLTSSTSIVTWTQIGFLGFVALLSLSPVLLKDKLKKKFE